jgi:hypothetical protein
VRLSSLSGTTAAAIWRSVVCPRCPTCPTPGTDGWDASSWALETRMCICTKVSQASHALRQTDETLPPGGSLRRRPSRARRRRSRSPAGPRSRPSSQAATLRSRRPTATAPCRPTSRPCRAGNATSGAASTRSSCAPSPACTRPSNGTRPSMASRARAGSSAFTASRTAALLQPVGPPITEQAMIDGNTLQ